MGAELAFAAAAIAVIVVAFWAARRAREKYTSKPIPGAILYDFPYEYPRYVGDGGLSPTRCVAYGEVRWCR